MKSIKGTETEKNLLKSFAGESQARNRYSFFAKQAKKEGYEHISRIFMETAENERVHAKRFFRFLEGGAVEITATYPAGIIGDTLDNLKAAADGEHEEHTDLYPKFAETAEKEGFPVIAAVYRLIAKIEEAHEANYRKLYENLKSGFIFKRDAKVKWRCLECGHIHEGNTAPEKCPACEHPKAYFEIYLPIQ